MAETATQIAQHPASKLAERRLVDLDGRQQTILSAARTVALCRA
jgi:hypothetical protein